MCHKGMEAPIIQPGLKLLLSLSQKYRVYGLGTKTSVNRDARVCTSMGYLGEVSESAGVVQVQFIRSMVSQYPWKHWILGEVIICSTCVQQNGEG